MKINFSLHRISIDAIKIYYEDFRFIISADNFLTEYNGSTR